MSDWISVEDRLPADTKSVLVWCPERMNTYTASYRPDGTWNHFGGYSSTPVADLPSHWMEVPSPPTNKFARSYTTYQESITDKRCVIPRTTVGVFDSEKDYQKAVDHVERYRRLRYKQICEKGNV